jgi:hypothetical protein
MEQRYHLGFMYKVFFMPAKNDITEKGLETLVTKEWNSINRLFLGKPFFYDSLKQSTKWDEVFNQHFLG